MQRFHTETAIFGRYQLGAGTGGALVTLRVIPKLGSNYSRPVEHTITSNDSPA